MIELQKDGFQYLLKPFTANDNAFMKEDTLYYLDGSEFREISSYKVRHCGPISVSGRIISKKLIKTEVRTT